MLHDEKQNENTPQAAASELSDSLSRIEQTLTATQMFCTLKVCVSACLFHMQYFFTTDSLSFTVRWNAFRWWCVVYVYRV